MPTKRHYASIHADAIKADLIEALEPTAERAATQLEGIITKILRKTLRFASQFGTVGFRDANVKIEKKVRVSVSKGIEIEINALVVNGTGAPHFIWHLISFGRPKFRQRKTSPVIRERADLRTEAGTLTVNRFPGYSGEKFVVPAGAIVEGIPPRGWYEAATDELKAELKKFPTFVTLGLELKSSDIRRP